MEEFIACAAESNAHAAIYKNIVENARLAIGKQQH